MSKKFVVIFIVFLVYACTAASKEELNSQKEQKPNVKQIQQTSETPSFNEPQDDEYEKNSLQNSKRVTPTVLAIRKIEGSVVNIRTEKTIERSVNTFFGDPFLDDLFGMRKKSYKTQSLGSGVIILKDGTLVTNFHVVKDATTIFVITKNNNSYEAEFVGGDESTDIAVLKIKNAEREFPAATLGTSSDVFLGEPIIAMGNPYGLSSSVTTGVVSAAARMMNIGNSFSVFIQTDALINPGNSGGPLVNINGDVIGINTAIHRQAQGIGFSIPVDTVKRVLPEIIKKGKLRRGDIGFTVKETTLNNDDIVIIVESIEKGSNAEKIGLKVGDTIIKIGGVPVNSEEVLYHLLHSYPPSSSVEIGVKRNGETFKGRIILTERAADFGVKYLKNKYGIAVIEKDGYLTVAKSGNAKHIDENDKLVALNGTELNSIEQFSEIIADNIDKPLIFTLYKEGKLFQVKLLP